MLSSCLPCLTRGSYTALRTVSVPCTQSGKGSASGQHSGLPVPGCGDGIWAAKHMNSGRGRGKQEEQQRNLVPTLRGPALS